jgi:toxin ParE1/3/4
MEIRWLRTALNNLNQEAEYLALENPVAAREIVGRSHRSVSLLADNPALGHPGRLPGTRELVVPGTSYIVPYRVSGRPERVEMLRVFHAARRLPEPW